MRAGKFFLRPEYFCEVIAVESAFERLKQMPLYEIMPVFFMVLNPDGTVVHMNATILKVLGYDLAEVRGKDVVEVLAITDEYDRVRNVHEQMRTQTGMVMGEETMRTKTGELLRVEWRGIGVFDDNGQVEFMLGIGVDVTEHRRMEEELARRKQETELMANTMQSVFDGTPDLIWAVDREYKLMFFNKAIRDHMLKEYGVQIASGTFGSEDAWDLKFWWPLYQQVFQQGAMKFEHETSRGSRLLEVSLNPIHQSGEVVGIGGYCRDVTERNLTARKLLEAKEALEKLNVGLEDMVRGRTQELQETNAVLEEEIAERTRVEQELILAKAEADRANRAKSSFLANMSHEIRTPMNSILGFSELLLRDDSLSAQQRQYLDNINRSGEHLLALINDILDLSKIEAGQSVQNSDRFELIPFVHELERMFRLRMEGKGLQFIVEVSQPLPVTIITDKGKLRQILINLLGNALKFTKSGQVSLQIGGQPEENGQWRLQCKVADTGVGIAPEELPRIFHAFEQAQSGLENGGTGLGLTITKNYIRLLGGEIAVQSEAGSGSVFSFWIRVAEASSAGERSELSVPSIVRIPPGLPAPRILIVDDDRLNRQLLVRLLESIGFSTREAGNGQEGFVTFLEWHPDLILMDLRMPMLSGCEAIRRIRASEGGARVPIIAMTASVLDESQRDAAQYGADELLLKPFRSETLLQMIRSRLNLVYEYSRPTIAEAVPRTLTQDQLRRLSTDFTQELCNAALDGDYFLMLELTRKLESVDMAAATVLRGMVQRFEFQRLIDLLGGKETL